MNEEPLKKQFELHLDDLYRQCASKISLQTFSKIGDTPIVQINQTKTLFLLSQTIFALLHIIFECPLDLEVP